MIYTLIRRDNNGNIDTVMSFDSISSFDESWSATVTTQTVEKGFNISDNINIDPQTYDIQAILSSYSLFDLDREIVWDGENFSSKQSDADRHIAARDKLISIFTDRSILTILESTANSNSVSEQEKETELKSGYFKEIDNCVITSMSISHPDNATGSFLVSLKLQKIYVAYVTTVQVADGQMTPTLRPYIKESKTVSSEAKSGQPATDANGTPITSDDVTRAAVEEIAGGLDFAEEAAYRDAVIKPIKALADANRKAALATAISKVFHTPVLQGDSYIIKPTF